MRNRSGRPSSRAIRSILYGGYPSAAFATRSSARSISSKPSRNGLDNDGTRAMISKSYDSDFVGPFRHPGPRRSTWTSSVWLALIWAIGAKGARRRNGLYGDFKGVLKQIQWLLAHFQKLGDQVASAVPLLG